MQNKGTKKHKTKNIKLKNKNFKILLINNLQQKKERRFFSLFTCLVIMLGFEPRTPALKGRCSTN